VDKRLDTDGKYTTIDNLSDDWASYSVQERVAEMSAPSENAIRLIEIYHDRDIVSASDALKKKETDILNRGLQQKGIADNTVMPEELDEMIEKHEKRKKEKEKLI